MLELHLCAMQLDRTWLSRYWKIFEWFIKKDYVDINVRDNRGERLRMLQLAKYAIFLFTKLDETFKAVWVDKIDFGDSPNIHITTLCGGVTEAFGNAL